MCSKAEFGFKCISFTGGVPSSSSNTRKRLQDEFPALPFSNSQPSGPVARGSGTDPSTKWGRQLTPSRDPRPPSQPSSSGSSRPKPEDFPSLAAAAAGSPQIAQRHNHISRASNFIPANGVAAGKVSEGLKAMNKV